MRLLRKPSEHLAIDIIKRHGYKLVSEPKPMLTTWIWSRDGKQYHFDGWECQKNNKHVMAANPRYITLEEVTK